MKTAISLPDDLFEAVERIARSTRRGRSEVYAAALREYVARHAPDEVTEALDGLVDELGADDDGFVQAASRSTLKSVEW